MGYLLIVTLPAPLIYYDSPSCNFILNWVTIHYVGVVALSAQHAAITAQSGGPWPRNGPAAVMTSGANGSWVASGQGGCRTLGEGPDRLDRWGWASCNYLARTQSDTLGEMKIRCKRGPRIAVHLLWNAAQMAHCVQWDCFKGQTLCLGVRNVKAQQDWKRFSTLRQNASKAKIYEAAPGIKMLHNLTSDRLLLSV